MPESLMIIEDNVNIIENIYRMIEKTKLNVNILKTISNGDEALASILEYNPQIILLDLNLPKINGIYIINELTKMQRKNIDVIIISGEIELINKLSIVNNDIIKKILVKPFSYNDLIKAILEIIKNNELNKDLEKITNYLERFNFNKRSIYYKCLVQCMEEILNEYKMINDFEGDLYKKIAKRNNMRSEKNVKWGIEKLINSMIKYTDKEILNEYFPYDTPTPKMFMKEVIDKVK